ncbi:unnamed protein product [Peronospora belbahrii]|uniref:Uncharacterized protein n=1 Tax=Peronospora belbahrii TaxID=622444 RepID=A0ABN8D236_9STRA|nr:unnamed protein product [Peronospora belbahrii]
MNTQVSTLSNSDAELFLDEDIVCSAVNNYAICSLYCCDVKAAIAALERMVRSNPQRFLNGVVVFNLSSLYDLQFDNATSKSRKEMSTIANLSTRQLIAFNRNVRCKCCLYFSLLCHHYLHR